MEIKIDLSFSSPEGMTAHKEWLENPITRKMLDSVASAVLAPATLAAVPGMTMSEAALHNYGIQLGMATILDFLKTAPAFATAVKERSESSEPVASYGSERLVEMLHKKGGVVQ